MPSSALSSLRLCTVLLALTALPGSLAAQDVGTVELVPELSLTLRLAPGWERDARWVGEGQFRISTETEGGRLIDIQTVHSARLLDNRDAFVRGGRIETLRSEILGQAATLLRGPANDMQAMTIGRTRMRGTRILALPDLCRSGGEPIVITLISGTSFDLPENDPELAAALAGLTPTWGAGLEPCPTSMSAALVARYGAAPAESPAGEAGFQRHAALGLSVASPEGMNGAVEATGLHMLNGPDRLTLRLSRLLADQGELRPAALAAMQTGGSLDLGPAGVFDIHQSSQTQLYGRDYAIHRTLVIGRDRVAVEIGGQHRDEVTVLEIRNEGDGLPDWAALAPVHAAILDLLRAEGAD